MGWCSEFGVLVREGCGHPMRAGESSCTCSTCATVCTGKFSGCATVWAAGPKEVHIVHPVLAPGRPPAAGSRVGDATAVAATPPEQPAVAAAPVRTPVPAEGGAGRAWGAGLLPADGAASQGELAGAAAAASQGELAGADASPQSSADRRAEVLAWLQDAFSGVRSELRALRSTVEDAHAALLAVAYPGPADPLPRLVALVEGLPAQVVAAAQEGVRAALSEAQRDAGAAGLADDAEVRERGARMAAQLRHSLAQVHEAAADLREEMVRLASFREALAEDLPAVARAVDSAYRRADGRLAQLAGRVDSIEEPWAWEPFLPPQSTEEPAGS